MGELHMVWMYSISCVLSSTAVIYYINHIIIIQPIIEHNVDKIILWCAIMCMKASC